MGSAGGQDYGMSGTGSYKGQQSFYGSAKSHYGSGTCAAFECGPGFWQRKRAARRRCGGGGCDQEMCCRRATDCRGWPCGDGFMEIQNGAKVKCGNEYHGPCSFEKCCAASPVQHCKTGDSVNVVFDGDGQQYPAVISATTDDQDAFFITWAQSQETDMAAPAQVFRNGVVCSV